MGAADRHGRHSLHHRHSLLDAVGRLVEAEVNESRERPVAFFRDSAGITWPLPYAAGINFDMSTLTNVLHRLRKQADADVERVPEDRREIPGLARMLGDAPPPWHLDAEDVAEYLDL